MNISDKIFTYIDSYNGMSESELIQMYNQYRNSLIFIGDEQQIYNPLTGAYVGIGLSRFNEVINELANNTSKLINLDTHIHQNVVNSIWADFSESELRSVFTNSAAPIRQIAGNNVDYGSGKGAYILMTNQDLVVKGLFDTNGIQKRDTDELGNLYDDNAINSRLWKHITRVPSNSNYKGASGIQVNVHHTGNFKEGIDESGFKYSYWEGQDYLTIDDSYTWAYITSQSSYLINYSKKIATAQANRVYHDILGGNDPVYIEKSFNDIFELDDNDNLRQVVPEDVIYIRVNSTDHPDTGDYQPVHIYNDTINDYWYIYSNFTDPNTDQTIYYILKTNDGTGNTITGVSIEGSRTIDLVPRTATQLVDLLFPDDGYDKNPNGSFKDVVWFNIDEDATAQGQMNLADGIKTFREVAYILDKITDGPNGSGTGDGIITLTYNIAQNAIDIADIKNWKNNIGTYVVTDFSASSSSSGNYVLLNSYSADQWGGLDNPTKGSTKLDINLLLAQTYTLSIDGTNISYAAYLTTEHKNLINEVWSYLGDTTNDNYYIDFGNLTSSNIQNYKNNFIKIFGNDSEQLTIWRKTINSTTNLPLYTINDYVSIADLTIRQFNSGDYILFNYEKVSYPELSNGILDGLTTVNWVTTYVGHGLSGIIEKLNNTSDELYTYIPQYIHDNLTYNDTGEKSNYYVSRVDEADGIVIVKREKLPLDTILASQEVYGDDFFIPIEFEYAQQIVGTGSSADYSKIYYKDVNTYKHPVQLLSTDQYYLIAHTNNFTKIDTTNLSDPDGEKNLTNELLLNGGNFSYFKRIGNEFIDEGTSPENIFKFIPVDINELIDEEDGYIPSAILDILYYYNSISASPIGKYFDAFYRQNTKTGGNEFFVTSYVTYLGAATRTNTGLADAYDVRRTIESMFTWINLKSNKPYNNGIMLNTQEAESTGG